jgi:hypothetical protein
MLHVLGTSNVSSVRPSWNIISYLWENLGILPAVCLLGYFALAKKYRSFFLPFIFLFIVECVYASLNKRGFEQKSLSFLLIGLNVLGAVGFSWLWEKKNVFIKMLAVSLLFVVTISGFVDFMPIKNEFAYPFIGKDTLPLISWIRTSTPKNAIFVSYADIIDPVVLSGRKNYFGFFGNVGQYDRSSDVRRMYNGDVLYAKKLGISYILVPRWTKSDFPYSVANEKIADESTKVYEDSKFLIYHL